MNEEFEELLKNLDDLDVDALNDLCKKNKKIRDECKIHKTELVKAFLKKYQVDYQDPTNFIYFDSKTNTFIPKPDDLQKVFDLYLVHYTKTNIEIEGKNITSIPVFPNLKELRCQNNKLTQIPTMPFLQILNCRNNQLTQIEVMSKLVELNCAYNKLTTLPIFIELGFLSCGDNQLTTVPTMPNLKDLYCQNNKLTQIGEMPKLKELWCQNNKLTQIGEMPILRYMYCYNNKLTEIESMSKLKELKCQNNQLTKIEVMPNLEILWCYNNKLTQIPEMINLKDLRCYNNQLTKIQTMQLLQILDCRNNKLTQIPLFPNLKELYCRNNQLTLIPEMPNLEELQCDTDVEISPMPKLIYINDELYNEPSDLDEELNDESGRIKKDLIRDKNLIIFKKETINFMLSWVYSSHVLRHNYHFYKTLGIERDLQKTVENKNYVLYRGLSWGSNDKQWLINFANSFGTHKMYSVGDYLNLKIENLSSWSTDKYIASGFTRNENFSILLKLTINSKNVLVDIGNFYKAIKNSIKKVRILLGVETLMNTQKEIILKPGSYKLQIEELRNNSLNINSMEEWGKEVSTDDKSN